MFKCNNLDKEHVTSDKFTHYYIIDIPFAQLHFGDRDEFIRQKLSQMHNTSSNQYIDISEFSNSEISSILNFTILCTVNGFICNDCKVAVDDKGFKFKVGWTYSSDVEFIIYKLDECSIIRSKVNVSNIKKSLQQHRRGNSHLRESKQLLAEVLQGGSDMIDHIIHDQETVVDVLCLDDCDRSILAIVLLYVQP